MHRLVGFLVVISILFALDFYGFQGVKYLTRNTSSVTTKVIYVGYWSLTAFVLVITIGLFAGIFSRSNVFWRNIYMSAIVVNYFPKLVFFSFVFVDDIVRGIQWIAGRLSGNDSSQEVLKSGKDITRSEFILKTGAAVAAIPFTATAFGIISGAHDYRVRNQRIVLPHLPKAFDGIRIAQLSDIHSGSFFNKVAVKGGIELLNKQKPDVVFFTGDLVNDRASEVDDYVPIFKDVKADLGVYSVFGNHDYGDYVSWKSPQAKQQNLLRLADAHQALGWDLLVDENRKLEVDGASIGILGIQNWGAKGNFPKYGNMSKAYQGIEDQTVKLLLSHDPSHWDAEVRKEYKDVDIMFAGHTHGMQFGVEIAGLKWSPVQYMYKQWAGLYQEDNQYLYVNRGYGYIGFPGRIGMPPEITMVELVRA